MKIEIIGRGPITPAQLDEILFGTSTINKKNPLEEAMDKLLDEVRRGEAKTIIFDSLGEISEEIEKDVVGKYSGKTINFDIQSITANHKKNAFTVVWGDGSHTMIHLQPGDIWDDEKALAMCFVKHMFGDKSSFNDIFTEDMPEKLKVIPKEEKKTATISVDTPNGTVVGKINHEVTTVVDRMKEVEKKVDNVEKAVDYLKSGIEKASVVAEAVSNNFSKLVDNITGTPTLTSDPVEEVRKYKVYLYNLYSTDKSLLGEGKTLNELPKFLSAEQKKRICYPSYTRYWSDKTGLYLDYGSHSYYFFVPGLTMKEYSKALNNSN